MFACIFQREADLARHAAPDGAHLEAQLAVRLKGPLPLDHERRRTRVQPPVRLRGARRRRHGRTRQAVEVGAAEVPLRGRFGQEHQVRKNLTWKEGSLFVSISIFPRREIPSDKSLFLTIETTACAGTETEVNYLEHVQAVITLNSTRRGDVELFLRSPMGTR